MNDMNEKKNGFTIAELLIVVAIVAVLVSISIPIFSTSIQKAKQSVYLTNARIAIEAAQYVAMEEYAQGTTFIPGGAF